MRRVCYRKTADEIDRAATLVQYTNKMTRIVRAFEVSSEDRAHFIGFVDKPKPAVSCCYRGLTGLANPANLESDQAHHDGVIMFTARTVASATMTRICFARKDRA